MIREQTKSKLKLYFPTQQHVRIRYSVICSVYIYLMWNCCACDFEQDFEVMRFHSGPGSSERQSVTIVEENEMKMYYNKMY